MDGFCQKPLHVSLVEDDPDHADLATFSPAESRPKAKVVRHVSDGERPIEHEA